MGRGICRGWFRRRRRRGGNAVKIGKHLRRAERVIVKRHLVNDPAEETVRAVTRGSNGQRGSIEGVGQIAGQGVRARQLSIDIGLQLHMAGVRLSKGADQMMEHASGRDGGKGNLKAATRVVIKLKTPVR